MCEGKWFSLLSSRASPSFSCETGKFVGKSYALMSSAKRESECERPSGGKRLSARTFFLRLIFYLDISSENKQIKRRKRRREEGPKMAGNPLKISRLRREQCAKPIDFGGGRDFRYCFFLPSTFFSAPSCLLLVRRQRERVDTSAISREPRRECRGDARCSLLAACTFSSAPSIYFE